MTLTDKEYKEFLRIHLDLLFYVGQRLKIISTNITFDKFVDLDLKIKAECRDKFIESDNLLDDYLSLNFDRLTTEQISILTGFKKKITGDFIIYKCLTNFAIFLNTKDNKFYAVKALGDSFDDFFDRFPVLIKTTILPYNGKIIYDGFIKSSGVYFGSGITSTMRDDYKEAKKNNQILMTI
jgi:hypothetical protein